MNPICPAVCSICLENVLDIGKAEVQHLVNRAVQHVFHESCIQSALKEDLRCPLCRDQITSVNGIPVQNTGNKNVLNRWLLDAIVQGAWRAAAYLIGLGADVQVRDSFDSPAFVGAAGRGDRKMVELLLGSGIDVNIQDANNRTALMFAAGRGHYKTVCLLLSFGSSSAMIDLERKTALDYALDSGNESVLRIVLKNSSALVDDAQYGWIPLEKVATARHVALKDLLFYSRKQIDLRNGRGSTALIDMAAQGYERMVRLLLDLGATLEARDHLKKTALIQAAEKGHVAVVYELLCKGVNVLHFDIKNKTALDYAVQFKHERIERWLRGAMSIGNELFSLR